MLNGAADYTICYYDKRLKNTHAHQLAASLVFYSPLQTIFWYDNPDLYEGEPEIKWFEDLQTTFDDTKVIDGYPGKGITIARRKGDDWWVGSLSNNEGEKRKEISLEFLPEGRKYNATIYSDGGEKIKTHTHVAMTSKKVSCKDILRFDIPPRGGIAIFLTPVE